MKKEYLTPSIEVEKINLDEVVCSSFNPDGETPDDSVNWPFQNN